MKYVQFTIYPFAFLALLSCKTPKKTETTISEAALATPSLPDSLYRLNVSFFSRGSGIDRKAKKQLDDYVIQYEQKNKVKLNPEANAWGREGEIDYCFKLKDLNKNQQSNFIEEVKKLLEASTLIHLNENVSCRKSNRPSVK